MFIDAWPVPTTVPVAETVNSLSTPSVSELTRFRQMMVEAGTDAGVCRVRLPHSGLEKGTPAVARALSVSTNALLFEQDGRKPGEGLDWMH